jgi:chemotaxis regulatin CheY-phosphate phosphatase CheZ
MTRLMTEENYSFDKAMLTVMQSSLLCSQAMDILSDGTEHFGERGMRAAQEARTLTETIDSITSAISSRWRDTWEYIIGDVDEATELFGGVVEVLWDLFVVSGDTRNSLLKLWRGVDEGDLDGRVILLEGLANIGNSLVAIIEAIKEAWSNIFPPMTADKLLDLTIKFRDFTENLIVGEEAVENITRIFSGLFAVLDIVIMSLKGMAGIAWEIIKALTPVGDTIGNITLSLSDFIVALRDSMKEGEFWGKAIEGTRNILETISNFISKFVDALRTDFVDAFGPAEEIFTKFKEFLSTTADSIKEYLSKIGEHFQGFKGINLSALKQFSEDVEIQFKPFTFLADVMRTGMEAIVKVWEWAAPVIVPIAEKIGSAIVKFGQAFGTAITSGDFQAFLNLINTGVITAILLGLKSFVDGLQNITGNAAGVLEGVKGVLDGVRGSLEAYQTKLKADALMKIALAIGVLVAAIWVLSGIEGSDIAEALTAITVLFIELATVMIVLSKNMNPVSLMNTALSMIAISTAILILSCAVKGLAEIDADALALGLLSVTILLAEIAGFTHIIKPEQLISAGIGMIAFSAAIVILSSAVKSLGELDIPALAKGLGAVGILMLEIAGFSQIIDPTKLLAAGAAMIPVSAAIVILAGAMKIIATMNWEEIAKGLVAIGVVLAEIGLFTKLVDPVRLLAAGVAMIPVAAGITALAGAMLIFSSMSWEELVIGLIALGGALVMIGGFIKLLNPANLLAAAGAAMIPIGAGITIIAGALQILGSMSFQELAFGLIALAGALTAIAIAANAMTGALPGAAAILVVSAALMILAPALMLLGSMNLAEIGLALLALVGVFAVVGVAGMVLAPLTPIILALAAAIALLGVGVLAIGAGLLAFAAGLTALAIAGTAGAAALASAVMIIINLIPAALTALAEGLLTFVKVIGEGTPIIMEALTAIVKGIIQLLTELIPDVVEAIFVFVGKMHEALVEHIPNFVDAGMRLILGIMEGIAEHIQDITRVALEIMAEFLQGIAAGIPGVVAAGVDIIVAFLTVIGEETPRIVDAGFKMVIDFVNGLADAIRENTEPLVEAFRNLSSAMIEGLVNGILAGIKGAVDAVKTLGSSMLSGIKDTLGIKSPSTEFEEGVGANIALGTAKGIDDNADKVSKAAKKMSDNAYKESVEWIKAYREDADYLLATEIERWKELEKVYSDDVKKRTEIKKEIRTLEEKAAKEKEALDKENFEKSKALIEQELRFKRLSYEEELAAWKVVQSEYAEGTELRAKADKASYEASKTYIEKERSLKKMSLAEELAEWEKVQSRFAEGSHERLAAEQEMFNAIDKHRKMGTVSLVEAYESWAYIQSRYTDGTDERIRAELEMASVYEEIIKERKRLTKEIDKVEEEYAKAVESRAQSIYNSFGLFGKVKEKDIVDGEDLIKNLEDQVKALADWADDLGTLGKKGVDEGLLKELEKMGPGASAEIKALTEMSDKDLTKYQELWKEKHKLARTQSLVELGTFVEHSGDKIDELNEQLRKLDLTSGAEFNRSAKNAIDGTIAGYEEKLPEVVNTIENITQASVNTFNEGQPKYQEVGVALIKAVIRGFNDRRPELLNTAKTLTSNALGEISAFLDRFYQVGQNITMGFVNGMRSKIEEAARAAADVAIAAYNAAMQAAGVQSPSWKFYEMGKYCVMGFVDGLYVMESLAESTAEEVGNNTVSTLKNTLSDIMYAFMEDDFDITPVIRPVIDLSNVEAGSKDISKLLDKGHILNLTRLAGNVAAASNVAQRRTEAKEQLASANDSETTNKFEFTQNNYSPKALSRVEIYRQTRNQFSQLKGVLEGV